MQEQFPKILKPFFILVDFGFILYWLITAFGWIPDEYLFPDYKNATMVIWNWSFLPLDLFVSATGIYALRLHAKKDARQNQFAILSLAFTSASGLQAISFWMIQGWFDWFWWFPNLFLLIYPIPFLFYFVRNRRL
ncbi:hypothetical protein CH373_07145 [Leptospira perolatii]|uniref:YvaD family protein n=1 Tax=Leptospira perolatii TaxID=2023191 RepID=A0A2M9ZPA3_9LEPT|nr:DUF5360 family protein [Leptospira perolatii]PJZ70698.1 hypothetical protein CH360_04005 [Leptospira perolatii]PJZ73908.1 hypothetical protein CH373_07145 [Leptospira perolatii]